MGKKKKDSGWIEFKKSDFKRIMDKGGNPFNLVTHSHGKIVNKKKRRK